MSEIDLFARPSKKQVRRRGLPLCQYSIGMAVPMELVVMPTTGIQSLDRIETPVLLTPSKGGLLPMKFYVRQGSCASQKIQTRGLGAIGRTVFTPPDLHVVVSEELPARSPHQAIESPEEDPEWSARFVDLQKRAVEVLGCLAKAKHWMQSGCGTLGNKSPVSKLETAEGFEEAMNVLGMIDHGIFG